MSPVAFFRDGLHVVAFGEPKTRIVHKSKCSITILQSDCQFAIFPDIRDITGLPPMNTRRAPIHIVIWSRAIGGAAVMIGNMNYWTLASLRMIDTSMCLWSMRKVRRPTF